MTAIGARRAAHVRIAPAAVPANALWLVGTLGDAAAGLGPAARAIPSRGPAGRHLPPADPAARRRAAARAACPRHDGRLRRTAARRAADGGGEPAARVDIDLDALAAVGALSSSFAGEAARRGCSPRPAGDDYALLAALARRISTRQRFLYQTGRRWPAWGRSPPASRRSRSSAAGSRSSCRRHWVLSIRAISIGHFPIRHWLIGLSGLLCGMTLALLIR